MDPVKTLEELNEYLFGYVAKVEERNRLGKLCHQLNTLLFIMKVEE